MSVRERLKLAYENVVLSADSTWSTEFNSYQQTNMDLLLREKGLVEPRSVLRPRTVRDCIPNSKLAKYSNYEYNDSRELSYTLDDFKAPTNYEYNFGGDTEKEPWMLEEVDRFYKYYSGFYKSLVDTKDEENRLKFFGGYESPFLKSNSLAEYFLKLQVTKDNVRKLWDSTASESKTFMFRSLHSIRGEQSLLVYKSPAGRVLVSEYDDVSSELKEDYYEWCKNDFDIQSSLDQLNLFSSSLKRDSKDNTIDNQILENQTHSAQNRRLYSAVLQGFSSNKITPTPTDSQMTILRRNFSKNDENVMEKLGSINSFSKRKVDSEDTVRNPLFVTAIPKLFPNKSITNSRSVQTAASTSDVGIDSSLNSQCEKICQVNPMSHSQSNYFPLNQVVSQQPSRYRQDFVPNNYQYPSFYMFVHNSFQQNYLQPFYNPMFLQRTLPMSVERNFLQRNCQSQLPSSFNAASNFLPQNQFSSSFPKFDNQPFKNKSRTKIDMQKKFFTRTGCNLSVDEAKKPSETYLLSNVTSRSDCSIVEGNNEMDELVSKTVNLVLDDSKIDCIVPITGSQSDELERQALEQYTNSSDNVFQDLERQAAEEYEDNSENCLGPPKYDILFGGFFKQMKYCIS